MKYDWSWWEEVELPLDLPLPWATPSVVETSEPPPEKRQDGGSAYSWEQEEMWDEW